MTTIFLICAIIGGTIMICQFVMTLVGFGHHDFDMGGDAHGFDAHGLHMDGHDSDGHHGSTWLFSVVSFRTLVAAAAFFGIAGLAADAAQMSLFSQFFVAACVGVGAMYGTHWIIRQFSRLSEDGTVRIQRAVGQEATVYLSIPPANAGSGKVQIKVQDRLMDYEAISECDHTLATGTRVVVVAVDSGQRLRVEPVSNSIPVGSSN